MKYILVLLSVFVWGCTPCFAQDYVEKQSVEGTNLLKNPGFENARVGWTLSNGTPSFNTTYNILPGVNALSVAVSSLNGTVYTQNVSNCSKLYGNNLEISGYLHTTASTFQICSMNNGSEYQCQLLPAQSALGSGGGLQQVVLNMPAPSSGSCGVRVRTSGSTTGTVVADQFYVGLARNIGTVAQAEVVVKVTRSAAQSVANTTATKVQFNVEGKDVYGEFDSTTNYRFQASRAAAYVFSGSLDFEATTGTGELRVDMYVNGSVVEYKSLSRLGTVSQPFGVPFEFQRDLAVGDYVEFFAFQGTGSSLNIRGNSTVFGLTSLIIKRYPLGSETVVRPNSGADLLNTISIVDNGTCPANSIELTDAGGTIPAQYTALIARRGSSTLPSYRGLVPSGIGSSTVNGRTKTGPTNPGDKQEDQMQGHVHQSGSSNGSTGADYTALINGTGGTGANGGTAISDGSNGTPRTGTETRASSFGVRYCLWAVSNPFLMMANSVMSSSAGVEVVNRLRVDTNCSSSPCTITSKSGDWAIMTRTGTGQYRVDFTAGTYSAGPSCSCSALIVGVSSGLCTGQTLPTTSSWSFNTAASATPATNADASFHIICQGPR